MAKIVSISNQKGGVGKTTTAINLSASLAIGGKRVLLIDFDPQGNSTSGLGIEKNQLQHNCYDMLMGDATIQETIMHTSVKNLDIIPSNIDLAAADIDLSYVTSRESQLKKILADIDNQYDYIFIDCPPSLGLLTLNALVASHKIVIPIQSEFFALEGLSQLLNTIKIVKQRLNPGLAINGVVLTMYDSRTLVSKQVTQEIYKYFGDKVYNVPVPRNVKLVEAPSYGQPIAVYQPRSSGAVAYDMLTKQFLQREEG